MATVFPNQAGDNVDNDSTLRYELHSAGIQTLQEAEGKDENFLAKMLREQSGEVKTSVRGVLHGWVFERNWYYWVVKGPGLDCDTAMHLWKTWGNEIRANGDCACRSPLMWNKGFATTNYHIDTQRGLEAFADTLKYLHNKMKQAYGDLPEDLADYNRTRN